MALVIRTWRSNENPDNDEYVLIEGRQAGFMSWLLTKLGVDNTTTLRVSGSTVYFEQGSLAGFTQRVIPISRMSSAFFGYTKPWKQALLVAAVIGSMISGVAVAVDQAAFGFLLGLVVGAGIAILYYILNKTTTIGVVESGGLLSGLSFKRSVIEGQAISEKDGRRVIDIIRARIEDKTN